MKTTLRHLIASVLLVTAAVLANAQNASPATPSAPALVTFTVMAWDVFHPDHDLELNYTSRGKLRPMRVTWRDRSPAMECDGPGPLVFSRTVERDGQKTETPVATALIPEGITRALLVFGRDPAPAPGQPGIRILVIDDSYAIFPGQSARFLNYSRMTLGGSLGEQPFEVAPGGDRVVPAALPETNRLLPFRLARRDASGAWKKLRSTGLPMSPNLRTLVFLIEDPARPERPQMVLIRDTVAPPPPAGR